jgi:DNA recombination protein RmuC
MEILIIVFCSVLLVAFAILAVIVVKKAGAAPKDAGPDKATLDSIANVDAGVKGLKEALPSMVALEIAKQNTEIQKQFAEYSDKESQKLTDFESKVTDKIASNEKASIESAAAFQKSSADAMHQFEISMSGKITTLQNGVNETVNKRLDSIATTLNQSVTAISDKVNASIQDGFKANSDTMGSLKESLGAVAKAQEGLKDVQNSVTDLNSLLKGNQTRGAYGELQLDMLLESTFPNGKDRYYKIQDDLGYVKGTFEKVRPDADLIFQAGGKCLKLCIDSKFPFSQYSKLFVRDDSVSESDEEALKTTFRNDVRKKYRDIADKYIIEDVTVGNAVMFVPNDGVFAFIENEFPDLVAEARGMGVVLACPSTLQAIIVVFHNAAIESERSANVEKMGEALKGLSVEFARWAERWDSLQRTIQSAANKSDEMGTTVKKLGSKFGKIKDADFSSGAIDIGSQTDEDDPQELPNPKPNPTSDEK